VAWLGGSLNTLEPSGSVPPPGSFQLSKNTFDVRVHQIPLLGGRTQLAFDLGVFNGDTVPFPIGPLHVLDNVGWAASLLHERPIGPARNKLSVQYGTGVAADFRAVLTPIPGRTYAAGDTLDYEGFRQWRLVEDLHLDPAGPLTLQLGAVWQEIENGASRGNRLTWTSLGIRPAWHFNRYSSVELEASWDHTDQSDGVSGSLFKVTLAPQITPTAAVLSRPSIRAFVTWARWSDGFVGLVAPVRYGTTDRGFAAGVQLETWW
jgi:maltoporin